MSSKPAKAPKPAAQIPGISERTALRERARRNIEDGAITDSYSADRKVVIKLLNDALATEYVCVLRYYRHYFMAKGMLADAVKAEFLEHAQQEQAHAGKLAERIVQLGGEPDFNPDTLTARSHAEYKEGSDLRDMVRRPRYHHQAHPRRDPGAGRGTRRRVRRSAGWVDRGVIR